MTQEEMMDLLEQQQTEIEQLKMENKNLTGENQLMKEQIVKMSESDLELAKAKELKQESERIKLQAEQDKNSNSREYKYLQEEMKKTKAKEQELEATIKNTKDTIEEQTQERTKRAIKEQSTKTYIKNNLATTGIILYSVILSILYLTKTYTSFHLLKIKNFFITFFRIIKKIIFDMPVSIWNLRIQIENIYLSIALRILFICIYIVIVFLILRFLTDKIKNYFEYLHNSYYGYHGYYNNDKILKSIPLRTCISVLLCEYLILWNYAEKIPINYNYIFVIIAVLSIFLINKVYLTTIE